MFAVADGAVAAAAVVGSRSVGAGAVAAQDDASGEVLDGVAEEGFADVVGVRGGGVGGVAAAVLLGRVVVVGGDDGGGEGEVGGAEVFLPRWLGVGEGERYVAKRTHLPRPPSGIPRPSHCPSGCARTNSPHSTWSQRSRRSSALTPASKRSRKTPTIGTPATSSPQ